MMIGNDIVKVPRMQGLCKNQRLVNRIFTKGEQEYIFDVTSTQLQLERMAGKLALKEAVAKAITAAALKEANFADIAAAEKAGTAFVFMGHGTSHTAKISYSQMQTQMEKLGYKNVFIGTVEGEPEDTACEAVIEKVAKAGYKNVILRPLMVVAGDHANNDMAGDEEDSWKSIFEAAGYDVTCVVEGLGQLPEIQALFVQHAKAAIDSIK